MLNYLYRNFSEDNVPQTSMTDIFKQLQKNRKISQSGNFRVISICHEKIFTKGNYQKMAVT